MHMLKLPARNLPADLSLLANFSWTFVGNVIYAGCQWAMLVVLAKFGSPEMVGRFALGLAITAPILMLTNLHLRSVQATDSRHTYLFGHYVALRLITTMVALVIVLIVLTVSAYQRDTVLIILMLGVAKAIEAVSDVFYGLLQQHERMDRIAKSMILKGILSLAALAAGLYFSSSLLGAVIGLASIWVLVLCCYDIPNGAVLLRVAAETAEQSQHMRRRAIHLLRPIWNAQRLRQLTWLAFPLGIVMMLNSLNINIPRYVIQRYLGEYELGIFAAMAYVMVAGTTVIDAIGQSSSPRLSKHYADGDIAAFRRLLFKLIGISALMGIVGVVVALLAGKEILKLLYQPEYASYSEVFVWLIVGTSIGYVSSLLGYSITAARFFKIQIPLNLAFIGILVIASFWLIPIHSLLGAAWATCIAFAIQIPLKLLVIVYALHERAQ
jgi:O-antigen/teichoic acid export membrane protein